MTSKSSGKRKEPGYGVMIHEQRMLSEATEELQRRVIDGATVESLLKYDADFETWAHKNQLPPGGEGWRIWLMLAGRGFGKTRAGAEWIFRLAIEPQRMWRRYLLGNPVFVSRVMAQARARKLATG